MQTRLGLFPALSRHVQEYEAHPQNLRDYQVDLPCRLHGQ